ncbi:MAG: hypothetical protein AUG89_06860 [Acidobacteria bacterium 13_1_20CM_4_56_7]|nr:MAG: hypothetical protein AUG89_06860 [Acidobacteria bacterium 13_1_20CM_4_56_7]
MRVSKRRLAVYSFLLLVLLSFLTVSRKYIWLYATRNLAPAPASADLLRDPKSSQNPEILLAEANRLAWVFNWPKAQPLYVRAEELSREKGDTRNEVYAQPLTDIFWAHLLRRIHNCAPSIQFLKNEVPPRESIKFFHSFSC